VVKGVYVRQELITFK